MKAKDLELQELVTFHEGNIDLYGRRLVLHSIHAFGRFRKDLIDMLGFDNARRVFTRFGFFWGQTDAAAMKRVHEWDDPLELLQAAIRFQTLEGIVSNEVESIDADLETGRFSMEIRWHNSGESEEHLAELGWSDSPICWKLVGYASGCATYCMEKNIYFLETSCMAKGDDICHAVGKDRASWGSEIERYLKYFETEDIKGEVARLSKALKKKTRQLAKQKKEMERLHGISSTFFVGGKSKAIQEVFFLADRVAKFDSSVLITGETGVGKEVVARYIHDNSYQNRGSFVVVNCGALPETLLESELFGHKRGSFTGAVKDRIGLLEQASGGTVFLDEIGDISQNIQLKLLRVLQEKEILRVGENKPRKIDVRVLAATHRDLDEAVTEGAFRKDLLYRLKVVEIRIPPLRERKEDILPLARFIVKKLAERFAMPNLHLDSTCIDYLLAYSWPGNVRELENALERATILSKEEMILPDNLPPHVYRASPADKVDLRTPTSTLEDVEMAYIEAVLRSTEGNRSHAARILGVSPSTLWRKLKKQGT